MPGVLNTGSQTSRLVLFAESRFKLNSSHDLPGAVLLCSESGGYHPGSSLLYSVGWSVFIMCSPMKRFRLGSCSHTSASPVASLLMTLSVFSFSSHPARFPTSTLMTSSILATQGVSRVIVPSFKRATDLMPEGPASLLEALSLMKTGVWARADAARTMNIPSAITNRHPCSSAFVRPRESSGAAA